MHLVIIIIIIMIFSFGQTKDTLYRKKKKERKNGIMILSKIEHFPLKIIFTLK